MTNTEIEKPTACQCCGAEKVKLKFYPPSMPKGHPGVRNEYHRWFCNLCASTMASTALYFSHYDSHTAEIMATICFVGNEILKAVKPD